MRLVARSMRIFLGLAIVTAIAGVAFAQGRKGKAATPAQLKSLDFEADRLQQSFLTGLEDLAKGYEEAGQLDRSKKMLEEILKIDPENAAAQKKLKEFDEAIFNANEVSLDVDASYGWTFTNVSVTKEMPVRFSSTGTYKFIVNETLGPDGFPVQDIVQDMADLPVGALVGVIVPPRDQTQGRPTDREGRTVGKTFLIGSQVEYTPTEDGLLYLKLNVPPASKCIGKVKATISGNIHRAR